MVHPADSLQAVHRRPQNQHYQDEQLHAAQREQHQGGRAERAAGGQGGRRAGLAGPGEDQDGGQRAQQDDGQRVERYRPERLSEARGNREHRFPSHPSILPPSVVIGPTDLGRRAALSPRSVVVVTLRARRTAQRPAARLLARQRAVAAGAVHGSSRPSTS